MVGCNGVALAQLLNYWKCKVFPDSTKSYYCWTLDSTLNVNFYNQDYDWNVMETDVDATSELMYHCGVAVNTVPWTDSIGGSNLVNVRTALQSYFGFNTGNVEDRDLYTDTQWKNLIKAEINAGRPIFYSAESTTSYGHTWIIDGYDSNNKFHCNWGWANSEYENDVFYELSNLSPLSFNFDHDYNALIGVYPILDACSGLSGSSLICYPGNAQYSVTIPSTARVSWSKTGNLTPVGATTNPTFTVSSTSNSGASGTITATIKNSHGQAFLTRTKTVWVGRPNNSQIDMIVMFGQYPYTTLCTNMEQTIAAGHPNIQQQGIQSFYWDFGSWSSYHTGYDFGGPVPNSRPTLYLGGYPPSSQVIKIKALNQCDNDYSMTYAKSKTFYAQNCFGYFLTFSPNPASNETILTIETTSPEKSIAQTVEWEMEVFNPAQSLKEKKTKINGNSIKIQTAGWKEGVYLVRVKYNDEILTGKLVVKK